jgi:hypothetical protein
LEEVLGKPLLLGNERSASVGALSLSTVGERLEDELGELLGERLSDDDKKPGSAIHGAMVGGG